MYHTGLNAKGIPEDWFGMAGRYINSLFVLVHHRNFLEHISNLRIRLSESLKSHHSVINIWSLLKDIRITGEWNPNSGSISLEPNIPFNFGGFSINRPPTVFIRVPDGSDSILFDLHDRSYSGKSKRSFRYRSLLIAIHSAYRAPSVDAIYRSMAGYLTFSTIWLSVAQFPSGQYRLI